MFINTLQKGDNDDDDEDNTNNNNIRHYRPNIMRQKYRKQKQIANADSKQFDETV
jgi:hypothetical protein